jgi:hypothetical protein
LVQAAAFARLAEGRALANIHRYENRLHRIYGKALRELEDRQQLQEEQGEAEQNEPDTARTQPQAPQQRAVQNEPDRALLAPVTAEPLPEFSPAGRPAEFLEACYATVARREPAPQLSPNASKIQRPASAGSTQAS